MTIGLIKPAGLKPFAVKTLGAPAGTITLPEAGAIPATARDLLVVVTGRSNAAAVFNLALRFNGDATAVYDWQTDYVNNATPTAGIGIAATEIFIGNVPSSAEAAGMAGSAAARIFDYARTQWNKNVSGLWVNSTGVAANDQSGSASGVWKNTAAITSVSVVHLNGSGSLAAGTTAALYLLD